MPEADGDRSRMRRMLYVDTYIERPEPGRLASSDSIGYGITSSGVLKSSFTAAGFVVGSPGGVGATRTDWLVDTYRGVLEQLRQKPPDVIFLFHCFTPFAVEIRRMLLDLGVRTKLIGYVHGSHWDATDKYRVESYPGLELADVANMAALDLVLLDSETMLETLRRELRILGRVAEPIMRRARVIGLPINTDMIDAYRTEKPNGSPTVIFNHAPIASKAPLDFLEVAERLLKKTDAKIQITRRFSEESPGFIQLRRLKSYYPHRIEVGNDLPIPEYYSWLWASHFQVSTASHESLGVSTLEAMYTGNCTLLPRLGSYPEITGDVDTVLYQPGDLEELEAKLLALMDNEGSRTHIAARLRRQAAKFAPRPVMQRLLAAIEEVLTD